ncbi:MAG: valine--pyruvate transaminase [Gammaproteobacteria bacterium]|nr:valine--pyruvate transaminase [Gammaproteobacteria bacterium]
MKFSRFGDKFTRHSGILQLMDDFAMALQGDQPVKMLGGGNPGIIPEALALYRESMEKIVSDPDHFSSAFANYDTPQGRFSFIDALVELLNHEFHWNITRKNVVLTNGSQNAFFFLFNLLGGKAADGRLRKILLPLTPEYVGYADLGVQDDFFVSEKPLIDKLDERVFKYRVDFSALPDDPDLAAICVSRPTNPTGNVLSDAEIAHLDEIARQRGIPLIIDNAYGAPFPNIINNAVKPTWNDNTIMCMSLSKLGLPALRTGIVIANEQIVDALASMNAIVNLSPGGIGASLLTELVKSGRILQLSQNVIQPFYAEKARLAQSWFNEELEGIEAYCHKPEGAIFLWFWFPGLPITVGELYERLKKRGVLVVPGHYFFPGIDDPDWRHPHECIRVSYAQDNADVRAGIKIIAEEVKNAYRENKTS